MDIKFSKEQYEALIKLVYLGEWVANSARTDDVITDFDELLCYVLSQAKEAGHDIYVQYDDKLKKYFPSQKLEEDLDSFIEEYNTWNFWEDLVYRMAERDLVGKYGREAVTKMSFEQRMEKEQPFLDKYYEEFEKNGIENLKM